jgi:hypothetical protein
MYMITRPSTLTPEEMEKLIERLANHGARISMTDPRVTSVQTWIMVTMGGIGIAVGGWGVKSINDLNQNMAAMLVRYEYDTRRVERIERHIEVVDGRVVTLEKKVLR